MIEQRKPPDLRISFLILIVIITDETLKEVSWYRKYKKKKKKKDHKKSIYTSNKRLFPFSQNFPFSNWNANGPRESNQEFSEQTDDL